MSNAVLPALVGLQYPVRKSPVWSTSVKTAASGKESRSSFWSYPRWRYSLSYDVLRSDATAELQQLVGFFNARHGSFDDWLFTDPDDNTVTGMQFAVGDGATTTFYLSRIYGGFAEPVVDLVPGWGVLVNGVSASGVTPLANGGVTFSTAPANGAVLTWNGSFYRRCRFVDDQIDLEKFMAKFWQLGKLDFISVK